MWLKRIIGRYAIISFLGFAGVFIVLVTFGQKNQIPVIFPGDIKIIRPEFLIYLPFGTSLVSAVAIVIATEIYYFLLRLRK